jgi:DNA-binding NarL/FixJ family response regulator
LPTSETRRPRAVGTEAAALFDRLTPGRPDVVVAATEGKDDDTVAAGMFVAPLSVVTHESRAMTKVQARDRTQLVAFAYRGGLVR